MKARKKMEACKASKTMKVRKAGKKGRHIRGKSTKARKQVGM